MGRKEGMSGGTPQPGVAVSKMDTIMDEIAARFILTCPIEEFKSFERLFFQIEAAHWFYIDHFVEHDESLPSLGMKDFTRLIFKHCPMLAGFQQDVENHVKSFSEYKVGVPVYGCIIVNESLDKCLLVKGWHKNSTWGFPKGKINQNEPEGACAVREVWEEVGYDCGPLLNESDHLRAVLNSHAMKLYIIAGVPESTHFVTQTVKEISRIEWFYIKDLPTNKSSSNFFLVTPFVRQLQEWINCKKAGKPWSPKAPKNPTPTPTKNASTPGKGGGRSESAPTRGQQPRQHPSVSATGEAEACSRPQPKQILKRGEQEGVGAGGRGGQDGPGNHVFGSAFKFDAGAVMRAMG